MKLKLRKAPVKVILVLICVIALLIVIVSLLLSWEQRHYSFNTDDEDYTQYEQNSGLDEVYHNGAWYVQKPQIETILCIGVDSMNTKIQSSAFITPRTATFWSRWFLTI